jgi:hypothetical protein
VGGRPIVPSKSADAKGNWSHWRRVLSHALIIAGWLLCKDSDMTAKKSDLKDTWLNTFSR